ncbi:Fc.00g096720.m01.CDS01 [Cosmosporella sp. VM-42]
MNAYQWCLQAVPPQATADPNPGMRFNFDSKTLDDLARENANNPDWDNSHQVMPSLIEDGPSSLGDSPIDYQTQMPKEGFEYDFGMGQDCTLPSKVSGFDPDTSSAFYNIQENFSGNQFGLEDFTPDTFFATHGDLSSPV